MAYRGKISMTLVVFTHTFPYGIAEWFLETEIPYLAQKFQKVIIVPLFKQGVPRSVPEGVIVDTSSRWYSESWTMKRIIQSVFASVFFPPFYLDICNRPQTIVQMSVFLRLIGFVGKVSKTYQWLHSSFRKSYLEPKNTVFYTYWLGPQSFAVGLGKVKYPEIKLISRVHGLDLYEDRHLIPYVPLRKEQLQQIDRIFAISEHGMRYLTEKYPFVGPRCEVSHLGVTDPGFSTPSSTDGIFRIVSCSSLLPVKSLGLLIEGLSAFTTASVGLLIEWHHLGDGPMRSNLESMAENLLKSKVRWFFHGQLANSDVFEFYRTNQIDVFVNVSKSEGIPVSIMEAQSCGIPVIAPSVGGIPEIVNSKNGVLLEKSPTPRSIARALKIIASNKGESLSKRTASKRIWRSMYNADRNYNAFVDRIMKLFC